jgi:hypothetical protein
VIDAGFDAAVRLHWQARSCAASVCCPSWCRAAALLPGAGAAHRPAALAGHRRPVDRGQPGHLVRRHRARLSLVYASADQRLLEFRGTSNLRDARGSYPQVTVRFSRSGWRPASEWQQAWAQPLTTAARYAQVKSNSLPLRIHCAFCCVQEDTTPAEIRHGLCSAPPRRRWRLLRTLQRWFDTGNAARATGERPGRIDWCAPCPSR